MMTKGSIGICALALVLLNLAIAPVSALANEDGSESTFWQDRANAKAQQKAAKPAAKSSPKSSVKKTTSTKASTPARRATVRRAPAETAPSGLPPTGEARFIRDEVIVRFSLSARQSEMNAIVRETGLLHLAVRTFRLAGVTLHRYRIANGASVEDTIRALEASAAVVSAQPNYLYLPAQDAKTKPGQYALARLAVAPVAQKARGSGVRLAIIDSVVDVAHPEFAKSKIETHDVSDAPNANPDAHGTSIAGIAAAGGTLTGIAPDADIVAIAAFAKADDGQTYGNSWTIATALDSAASADARVVNMSFAGPRDPLLEQSIGGGARRGMILVAAAGNDGPSAAALYPGAYEDTIAVTAIDEADAVYANANRGAYIAFAAPGVNILAAAPGGAYGFSSGTSLASAHVSALVALLLGADPALDREKIAELLSGTSSDLGEAGRDVVFGSGVPSAAMALKKLGK